MTPIPPLPPLMPFDATSQPTYSPGMDAARFEAMVNGPSGENNFAASPATGSDTPIASAITHQVDLFKGVLDSFQRAKDGMSTMTQEQRAATSIDMMIGMSISSLNFSAWTSVGQSMKSAVQTLMKNQ